MKYGIPSVPCSIGKNVAAWKLQFFVHFSLREKTDEILRRWPLDILSDCFGHGKILRFPLYHSLFSFEIMALLLLSALLSAAISFSIEDRKPCTR